MKKRILFVGKDQPLWQDARERFSNEHSDWEGEFVDTGAQALNLVEPFPFAAVVADVQLPDKRGVELLDEIMQRQPKAQRVVLSEKSDVPGSLGCVGTAHRHLIKPCDVEALLGVLEQSADLQCWFPSQAVQALIAQIRHVPSPPTIYFQIAAELGSPSASIESVSELIARDPAVTGKMLQLANSAVFGIRQKVVSPVEAVAYLGLETTKALTLLAHTFALFDQAQLGGFCMDSLWWHSVMTGRFAQRLARLENSADEVADHSFTAGLLHDLGKLLFAANLPRVFAHAMKLARAEKMDLWEAERQIFGACHGELGGCLLGVWGLPVPIVEAVALHHRPARSRAVGFTALTAVHAADVIAHRAWSDQPLTAEVEMDLSYLTHMEMAEHVWHWERSCLSPTEDAAKAGATAAETPPWCR